MSDNTEKAKKELEIFQTFVSRTGLASDLGSIENREPPEPDVLFRAASGKHVAFELKEVCDPSIAKLGSDLKSGKLDDSISFLRSGNPIHGLARKTRDKKYVSDHPIELLFYTDGRVISPVCTVAPVIQRVFDSGRHPFRCVWFMEIGDKTCKRIWTSQKNA